MSGIFKYIIIPFFSVGFSNALYTNQYFTKVEKISLNYNFSVKDFAESVKKLEIANIDKNPSDAIKSNVTYKTLIKLGPWIKLDTKIVINCNNH